MAEIIIQVKDRYGEFLESRAVGKKIREEIEQHINDAECIIMDLEGVRGLSNSAADECFGKFLLSVGAKKFKEKIKFRNMNDLSKAVINFALNNRMKDLISKSA